LISLPSEYSALLMLSTIHSMPPLFSPRSFRCGQDAKYGILSARSAVHPPLHREADAAHARSRRQSLYSLYWPPLPSLCRRPVHHLFVHGTLSVRRRTGADIRQAGSARGHRRRIRPAAASEHGLLRHAPPSSAGADRAGNQGQARGGRRNRETGESEFV